VEQEDVMQAMATETFIGISAGPKNEIAPPYSDPDLICRNS
jgi:hypothetical protein